MALREALRYCGSNKDAKRLAFALDTAKMLLGFFVGVATGVIGETHY
jgi:hypothetical protein